MIQTYITKPLAAWLRRMADKMDPPEAVVVVASPTGAGGPGGRPR